ncbi:hypothetical protein Agub_g1966 [Astrephomene gubernaculifera]|uniref:Uncharacterized protein n=1 Tax=Astrephomene gubernaculifera TaxID=47775 RepID=A0AAD3DJ39_9CHLO|nr:hypothetical protein Agub_g1966 [Astrephomene gubernaculifera]
MSKQKRLLQAAVRVFQIARRGSTVATPLEKSTNTANRLIYRKCGIPNAVQLGHTSTDQPSAGGSMDRPQLKASAVWPGHYTVSQALAKLPCRGNIVEICSPGRLCADVAAQLALTEARSGSVLWLAVGASAAEGPGSSPCLPKVPVRQPASPYPYPSSRTTHPLLFYKPPYP